ncbi:MAG: ribonuclease H-like domain-containing protein [Minisyncoccia bacterium]
MDRIVLDIETKNSFEDVGGRDGVKKLDVSVVGVYSYDDDKYIAFDEHEMDKLGELLKRTQLIVTFAGARFDLPVLEKYLNFNVYSIDHYDILEAVEKNLGRRIGLGILAEANVGAGKSSHGMEAIEMYKRGEIQELKDYCLQDVKITKDIYELIKKQGYLWIPERYSSRMTKLAIEYKEELSPQNQLI